MPMPPAAQQHPQVTMQRTRKDACGHARVDSTRSAAINASCRMRWQDWRKANLKVRRTLASGSSSKSRRKGITPHRMLRCCRTSWLSAHAGENWHQNLGCRIWHSAQSFVQ